MGKIYTKLFRMETTFLVFPDIQARYKGAFSNEIRIQLYEKPWIIFARHPEWRSTV
jgi:hypothetical protein